MKQMKNGKYWQFENLSKKAQFFWKNLENPNAFLGLFLMFKAEAPNQFLRISISIHPNVKSDKSA
jgi:hypothetical protein